MGSPLSRWGQLAHSRILPCLDPSLRRPANPLTAVTLSSPPPQGLCNNRLVYLPIALVVATSPRVMDPVGRTWERVLSVTRQPNTAIRLDAEKVTSAKTFL
jgi:hypothetical protein